MSEKEVPVSERIKILFQHFGAGNLSAFARELDVSAQAIRDLIKGEKGGPSWPVLQNILRAFPSVSTDWLVLGQGSMLRDKTLESYIPSNAVSLSEYRQLRDDLDSFKNEFEQKLKYIDKEVVIEKARREEQSILYSLKGKPNPKLPYDGLLTVRLGITEEQAWELIEKEALEAWNVGPAEKRENWRVSEGDVRLFLQEYPAEQRRETKRQKRSRPHSA